MCFNKRCHWINITLKYFTTGENFNTLWNFLNIQTHILVLDTFIVYCYLSMDLIHFLDFSSFCTKHTMFCTLQVKFLKSENLLPLKRGSILFFPFRVDPFSEGGKTSLDRIASHENVFIPCAYKFLLNNRLLTEWTPHHYIRGVQFQF